MRLSVFIATETNLRNVFEAARNATMSSALMFNFKILPTQSTLVMDLCPGVCLVSGRIES